MAQKRALKMLSNVRVIAFTHFMLGPAGVQYLADMGADVIKVEAPGAGAFGRAWAGGDTFPNGVSAFFMLANRNLRSVTLNLKSTEGRDAARRLVESADVVVENFSPGTMEKFGLGYEDLRKIKPDIIYVSGSGYGKNSPFQALPAQDLLLQARSGLASISGERSHGPIPMGVAVVDQHSAALLAMAVLAALLHRNNTGEGQEIEVIMLLAALDLGVEPIVYTRNGGTVERPRGGIASAYHAAPYGMYETSDGYIVLSMSPMKLVRTALGGPPELEPYDDPAIALTQRDEIYVALSSILRKESTENLLALLQAEGVWCAAVNNYENVFEDPIVADLDPLLRITHPIAGEIDLLKHPVKYGAGEPEVRYLPPTVGQHTDEVLREIGYSEDELERMRQEGVL